MAEKPTASASPVVVRCRRRQNLSSLKNGESSHHFGNYGSGCAVIDGFPLSTQVDANKTVKALSSGRMAPPSSLTLPGSMLFWFSSTISRLLLPIFTTYTAALIDSHSESGERPAGQDAFRFQEI